MKPQLLVLSIFFCLMAGLATAQTVVLEQDVNRDTIESNYGPNRRHYIERFIGGGFGIGTEQRIHNGAKLNDIKYGLGTGMLQAGMRYKLRLFEYYALGLGLDYNRQTYNFKQRNDKYFPSKGKHEKERLYFHNLALEAYQRINFGPRRGDYLGKYVDLGAYGEWNFSNTLLITDKLDSANALGARRVKTKHKNLNYVNRFNYGLTARVGTNRFMIFGRYRLSDLIDPKMLAGYPDLSRLTVGVQIGLQ